MPLAHACRRRAQIHLSVKFAGRLDAPVTVLNVDNEVVEINATHLSFSGIGRQKPKTYVVNLEFFEPIDAENSSWSFGSVGTVSANAASSTTSSFGSASNSSSSSTTTSTSSTTSSSTSSDINFKKYSSPVTSLD